MTDDYHTSSGDSLSDRGTASIPVYLAQELENTQNVEFDIFVHAVFGLSPTTVKDWSLKIREQNWLEDSTIYRGLDTFCSTREETDRYTPLADIVNRIIELARGSLSGIPYTYPIDDLCLRRNNPIFIQTIPEHGPFGVKRKPDLVMIRGIRAHLLERPAEPKTSAPPGIRWSHNIASWELKVKATMLGKLQKVVEDRRPKDLADGVEGDLTLQPLSVGRKRRSADELEDGTRDWTSLTDNISSDHTPAGINGVKKEAKILAGSNAMEMLACSYGTRLFCLNVVMEDDRIYLWYYDACGTVCTSSSISLIDDFEKAAALIVGMASCSPERLGALPSFVQPPSSAPYPTNWPPETLEDHTLTLDQEDTGKKVSLTLKQPVFTQYSLIGRRTFVYTVEPNRDVSDEDMIVKVSYQVNTRAREQDLVRLARTAGVGHLPQIHLSSDLWKMSDGVRQIFSEQGGIEYEDRTLRLIVYSRYHPLQSIVPDNPECIRDMAIQMIECLHDLKEKANILHRDISINNVMYELRGGVPHFILVDYDMAVILTTEDGERRKPTTKYQGGTLPFMAVDLLVNAAKPWRDPIPHFLRHDYESVFWLSVWCATVLMQPRTEAEKKAKKCNIDVVRAWETFRFQSIANDKEDMRHRDLVNRNITLLGKAASLDRWFRQWRRFWRKIDKALLDAEDAASDARLDNLPPPTFDLETVGGLFTRDTLMSSLNEDSAAPNVPSIIIPEMPDTQDKGATLLVHRAATNTTRGNRTATTTTKRKASSKKVEKATGKSPPASPSGRKKRSSTAAKGSTVKAAKKTTVKKAVTAVKTRAKAAITKSAAATRKTTENHPSSSDAEDEEPETIGPVVEHRYALRSRKAAPTREASPKKAARKVSPASSARRRKKPSTPVKETAVKAAAKRATIKKTATRTSRKTVVFVELPLRRTAAKKTSTTKDTSAAVTKKVTAKNAKMPEAEDAQDTTSGLKEPANIRDEAFILEPGENDMRRPLRSRR